MRERRPTVRERTPWPRPVPRGTSAVRDAPPLPRGSAVPRGTRPTQEAHPGRRQTPGARTAPVAEPGVPRGTRLSLKGPHPAQGPAPIRPVRCSTWNTPCPDSPAPRSSPGSPSSIPVAVPRGTSSRSRPAVRLRSPLPIPAPGTWPPPGRSQGFSSHPHQARPRTRDPAPSRGGQPSGFLRSTWNSPGLEGPLSIPCVPIGAWRGPTVPRGTPPPGTCLSP